MSQAGENSSGGVETWKKLTTSAGAPTSSNPRRSQRAFQEKERRKAYSSLEAFLKRVRSSPLTMTTSGHSFFASLMSCSLRKPWNSQQS